MQINMKASENISKNVRYYFRVYSACSMSYTLISFTRKMTGCKRKDRYCYYPGLSLGERFQGSSFHGLSNLSLKILNKRQ